MGGRLDFAANADRAAARREYRRLVAPQAGARTSHRPPISVLNGATTLEVTGANDSNTASASFTVLNRGRRLARIE